MRKNNSENAGQVGASTILIFFVIVLIASAAVAALINASGLIDNEGKLKQPEPQERSLIVSDIEGIRATNMSDSIDLLKIKVRLTKDSTPVDINHLVISITDGTTIHDLKYSAGNSGFKNFFTIGRIQDEDRSLLQNDPVINKEDLMIIYISTAKNSGLFLPPETNVDIILTPESKTTTLARFQTPPTYNKSKVFFLYP